MYLFRAYCKAKILKVEIWSLGPSESVKIVLSRPNEFHPSPLCQTFIGSTFALKSTSISKPGFSIHVD
jgi:hypothetical protein